MKKEWEEMRRNSIVLQIAQEEKYKLGQTRFGGQPDVPSGFVWPTFEGKGYCDDAVKRRPLAFLAQFNCAELAPYDSEHLLPGHGLLSFFYEMETQLWGFDPRDRGCARVFWFEDTSALSAADFPAELDGSFRFPMLKIELSQQVSYPSPEDFTSVYPEFNDYGAIDAAWAELGAERSEGTVSKLLGWPDVIQNSMAADCDLVTRGYDTGSGWGKIPKDVCREAKETAMDRWLLLFQLDTVAHGGFELMFGDCGRIYFFITREDLRERRFERVWLILQCG